MPYHAAAKSAKTAVAVLSGPTRSYQGWALVRMGKLSRATRRYIILRSCNLIICSTENPRSQQFSICLTEASIFPTNAKNECQIRTPGHRIWIICQDERALRMCRAACEFAMRKVEDHYKLVTHRQLGKGRSAEVVFAFNTVSGDHAAVKVMNKDKARNTDLEFAEKEVKIRMTIQHPCIVQTLDIFESAYDLFVVMELMGGGALDRRMNKKNSPLSEQEARAIMRRLFSALQHLHSRGIAHRNVKPENIFLDVADSKDWPETAKLTDFGLACFLDDPNSTRQIVGTPEYLAPEASIMTRTADGERGVVFGTEVDMWAAGVTLYNLLSLELPFEGEYPPEVFKKARAGKLSFSKSGFADVSPAAISLIRSLLNVDRRKRLTAETVMLHNWFREPKAETTASDLVTETHALTLTSRGIEMSEGQARFRAAILAIRALYRLISRTPGLQLQSSNRLEKRFHFNVSGINIAPVKSDLGATEDAAGYDLQRNSATVMSRISTGSTVKSRSSLGGDSTTGFARTISTDSRPLLTKRSDSNKDYFSRRDPRANQQPSFGSGGGGVHRLISDKAGHFSTLHSSENAEDQAKTSWRWRRRSARPPTGEH